MFKSLDSKVLDTSASQFELIEAALAHGFRGLHVDIVEMSSRAKARGMAFIRRSMESAKLSISSFDLPVQFDVDDAEFKDELETLIPLAEAAKELGCTRCLATINPAADVRPYHENFEFHRNRISDLCRILEPFGIQLGVGFRAAADARKGKRFQFIHEFEAFLQLISMVGNPSLGIVLDSWNCFVSGATLDDLRKLTAHQIVAVALADAPADETPLSELTEEARMLPGVSGRVDNTGLLTALAEMEYEGPVMVRPGSQGLSGFRRNQVIDKASEAFSQVWQDAGLDANGKLIPPAE